MAKVPKQPEFSEEKQGGHCGNRAPMRKVAQYAHKYHLGDETLGLTWEEGYDYDLLEYPACAKIELRSRAWADRDIKKTVKNLVGYAFLIFACQGKNLRICTTFLGHTRMYRE